MSDLTDWYLLQVIKFVNGLVRQPHQIRALYAIMGVDIFHRIPTDQREDFLALLFGLLPDGVEIPEFDPFPQQAQRDRQGFDDDKVCDGASERVSELEEGLSDSLERHFRPIARRLAAVARNKDGKFVIVPLVKDKPRAIRHVLNGPNAEDDIMSAVHSASWIKDCNLHIIPSLMSLEVGDCRKGRQDQVTWGLATVQDFDGRGAKHHMDLYPWKPHFVVTSSKGRTRSGPFSTAHILLWRLATRSKPSSVE